MVKDAERIKRLLKKLNLTTRPQIDLETVVDALKRDKKRKGDNIGFVLLQGIGSAVVEEIPIRELETLIKELF